MGKGGSKSTSTSYSGSSNPAFVPYALQGVNSVNQVYNQAAPGLQQLTGQLNNSIIPGLQGRAGVTGGVAGQGAQYNSDVLSGKYMHGNPYMSQILDQLNSRVSNDVNSQFSMAGRYGSDAHGSALTRELANADAGVLYGNYSDEMNRMGQSAQNAQSASTVDMATLLQALQQGSTMPYAGSESLANSLGALFSGGSEKSTSKTSGPGLLGSILGAGASLGSAALMASDRRLKTNIVRVGEWDDKGDGLGEYEWNWRAAPNGPKVRGVIADEVERLRPEAFVPNFIGEYAGVNYAAL